MIVSIAIIDTSTTTVNACIGYRAVVTAIESFLAIESVVIATKHTNIYPVTCYFFSLQASRRYDHYY